MLSEEVEVINSVLRWRQEEPGISVYLFTVAATWGSSPRPRGSIMTICGDGRHTGSVSGGCVELDLINRVRSWDNSTSLPLMLTYGVNSEEAQQFGIPCGGRLELFAERISSIDEFVILRSAQKQRKIVCREVNILTGHARVYPIERPQEFLFENNILYRSFGPQWRLLIIGAGQLAQILAKMAQSLEYSVILCEPREELTKDWNFDQVLITNRMPDEAVIDHINDHQCAVITLTHSTNLDDMALMEALESPAFYVGALGSKATSANRRKRLISLGIPEQTVNRLHAPIGLPIGSHTPAEIAVSILAEITAVRNGATIAENA